MIAFFENTSGHRDLRDNGITTATGQERHPVSRIHYGHLHRRGVALHLELATDPLRAPCFGGIDMLSRSNHVVYHSSDDHYVACEDSGRLSVSRSPVAPLDRLRGHCLFSGSPPVFGQLPKGV